MLIQNQIEEHMRALLPSPTQAPQILHQAMHHVVLAGGKRVRPLLLLGVAAACRCGAARKGEAELARNAACALEFIHTASLVHDDLPCFDDAAVRRGQPTVHTLFGESIAILVGDALLTLAFEVMAHSPRHLSAKAVRIIGMLATATGSREGIIGGQSLEELEAVAGSDLPPEQIERYHALKTAALFRLACAAGAVTAGVSDTSEWAKVGSYLGLAYQLADDWCDLYGNREAAGEPAHSDAKPGRPNAVLLQGQLKARANILKWLRQARSLAISLAPNPQPLIDLIDDLANRYLGIKKNVIVQPVSWRPRELTRARNARRGGGSSGFAR